MFQWLGIILIMGVFAGAYWYFKVYGSTIKQAQNGLITLGLVGFWSFNTNDMNGTTAYDRSGNSNNGTLISGPTSVDGEIDQALSFNGTSDYVDIPDMVSTGTFTYSFWYKTSNNAQTGIMLGGDVNNGTYVKYGLVSNNLFIRVISGGSSDNTISPGTANVWHHVVLVRDSSNKIDLYLDGGSANRLFSDAAQSGSTSLTHVAKSQDGQFFAGQMDEVRMYNRTLSSDEIQTLYKQRGVGKTNSSISQPQGTGRLDSGLAGYWKLDDGSGTSATDSSTNANTGTLTNGPTWGTGQIGGDVDLDGTNDYITMGDQSVHEGMARMTLSGWIKMDALPASTYMPISKSSAIGQYRFTIDSSGNPVFVLATTNNAWYSSGTYASGSTALTTSTWIHLLGTYDGQYVRIYVNGVLAGTGSQAISGSIVSNVSNFQIGYDSFGNYFNGQIDEVRLYNREFSSDEVGQLYRLNTPTSTDTGLKGYWSFNGKDMSGTSAYDRSGAGNTGTLTGGPSIAEGKVGQTLSFDGVNDYVTIPDSAALSPTTAFSVSFWTRITGTISSANRTLVSKTVVNQRTWAISQLSTGALRFHVATSSADTGTYGTTDSTSIFTVNQWVHITATYDGSGSGNAGRAKVYVNGIEQPLTFTGTISATIADTTAPLDVGNTANGQSFLTGNVDEARFYSRALTAGEIKGLYDMGADDKTNSSVSQPQGTGRLDSGLAGYWKLDDGSGTSATDSSTNGNTGTLTNGPTWTTGQIGGAVSFDGTDDYVTAASGSSSALNLTTNTFTISAWIYPTGIPGLNQALYHSAILDRWDHACTGLGYAFGFSNAHTATAPTELEVRTNCGSGSGLKRAAVGVLTNNSWQHVVVTANAGVVTFYVNGTSYDGGSGLAAPLSYSGAAIIGNRSTGADPFAGKIDETRVYNRALSSDEVAQLYRLNAPTGTDTSLKGYWSFNGKDMSGTSAYDRSGAGNTGTLTSGPVITEGKLGQALSFDGSDDNVALGATGVNITGDISITAWINPRSYGGGLRGSILNNGGFSPTTGYRFNVDNTNVSNGIGFGINTTGTINVDYFVSAASSVSLNTWQMVAVTFSDSGDSVNFYVNGVNKGTRTLSTSISSSAVAASIGSRNGMNDRVFDGSLDEVRLYNRALTEAEIKSLYNASR